MNLQRTAARANQPTGGRSGPLQIGRFYGSSRTRFSFRTERFSQTSLQRLPRQAPIFEHFVHVYSWAAITRLGVGRTVKIAWQFDHWAKFSQA
jgi:hypothetical protein